MFVRCTVCALGLLVFSSFAARAADRPSGEGDVSLRRVNTGQRLEIVTAARIYQFMLVDPLTGEGRAAVSLNGVDYSPESTVYLLGATAGPQTEGGQMMVLLGRIKTGLRLELGLGSLAEADRALTERVTSVRLLD